MKIKAKEKGSRLEYFLRDSLKHLDPKIRRSLGSGAFGHVLGSDEADLVTDLPISVEAKNQENTSLYPWWEQAKEQCKSVDKIPILAVKKNNHDVLAVMHWSDFVHLLECSLGTFQPQRQLNKRKPKKVKLELQETADLPFSKIKQTRRNYDT